MNKSNQTKPTIKEQISKIQSGFMSQISYEQYRVERSGGDDSTLESVKRNKNLYLDQATEQIIEVIDKEVIGGSEHKRDLSMFDAEMAEWQEENRLTRNALRKRQRQLLKGQTNE